MKCTGCGKRPHELTEYYELAVSEGLAGPEEAVIREEGTYDPVTGNFCCTDCYIRIGMPTSRKGWKA